MSEAMSKACLVCRYQTCLGGKGMSGPPISDMPSDMARTWLGASLNRLRRIRKMFGSPIANFRLSAVRDNLSETYLSGSLQCR